MRTCLLILERGRGRDREGNREDLLFYLLMEQYWLFQQYWLFLLCTLTRDQTCNLGDDAPTN